MRLGQTPYYIILEWVAIIEEEPTTLNINILQRPFNLNTLLLIYCLVQLTLYSLPQDQVCGAANVRISVERAYVYVFAWHLCATGYANM